MIETLLDLTNYATDTRVARRKNSKVNTQEFFTPYSIVKRMCSCFLFLYIWQIMKNKEELGMLRLLQVGL